MPNPAPGFVNRPDHRVELLPETRRVKVVFGGMIIAESSAALRVEETGHDPVYYLPEKDVRTDLMHRTDHHTRCPYKGEACYYSIVANGRTAQNAVWSYEQPLADVAEIAFYVAFYPGRVDRIEPELARTPCAVKGQRALGEHPAFRRGEAEGARGEIERRGGM